MAFAFLKTSFETGNGTFCVSKVRFAGAREPKMSSSEARRTPSARIATSRSTSAESERDPRGVSSSIQRGSTPVSARPRKTTSTASGRWSVRPQMFVATNGTSTPSSRHFMSCAHAARTTQRSNSAWRPPFSTSGMISEGPISP